MIRMLPLFLAAALAAAAPGAARAGDALAGKKALESDADHLMHVYVAKADPKDAWTPRNPYLLGYWHFKKGEAEKAKPLFEQALKEGAFTSRSRYLLAVIAWNKFKADGWKGDLSAAYKQLDGSIAEDPDYPSPYYLRGMMRWAQGHKAKEALEDLSKATAMFVGACGDILNDPKEADLWRRSDTKELLPGYEKAAQDCARTHHLEAKKP